MLTTLLNHMIHWLIQPINTDVDLLFDTTENIY